MSRATPRNSLRLANGLSVAEVAGGNIRATGATAFGHNDFAFDFHPSQPVPSFIVEFFD